MKCPFGPFYAQTVTLKRRAGFPACGYCLGESFIRMPVLLAPDVLDHFLKRFDIAYMERILAPFDDAFFGQFA